MTRIDFYSLPRTVQDRLIAAFRGEFEPKPLEHRRATRPTAHLWLGLSSVALVLLLGLWALGYGELDSRLGRQPPPLLGAYAVLAATCALGVVQAFAYRFIQRGLPFATGIYLFPANLIDARERRLGVHPLEELTELSAAGPRMIVVRFGRRHFAFRVPAAEREATLGAVRAASQRMKEGPEVAERRFLDPLVPPLVASPFGSDVPFAPERVRWLRPRWAVVGAAGLLGVPLGLLRDARSDARMFAVAQERDDVASYRRYLACGDAQHRRVLRELLPRAELRRAVAEGSVEAIQDLMRDYPDTDIQEEIARALRAALEAAFARAQAQGTLGALLAFAERYPHHGLERRFALARHAIYRRALERYRAKMPKQNVQIAGFVERLLATAERLGARKTPTGVRGPTVAIRLGRIPSRGFDNADQLVRRNPWFGGPPSLPSRYVDAAHVEPHAQQAATAFAEAFAREFDAEVVTFAPGAPLAEGIEPLPEATAPTLVLGYRLEPSGANYASKKPRCVLTGLALLVTSTFLLPGDPERLRLDHTVTAGIPVRLILAHDDAQPRGTLEAAVYDAMLKGLFADARTRYLAAWFRPQD